VYGNGGKAGFRSGRYDVEAIKLMNSRTNFAKVKFLGNNFFNCFPRDQVQKEKSFKKYICTVHK